MLQLLTDAIWAWFINVNEGSNTSESSIKNHLETNINIVRKFLKKNTFFNPQVNSLGLSDPGYHSKSFFYNLLMKLGFLAIWKKPISISTWTLLLKKKNNFSYGLSKNFTNVMKNRIGKRIKTFCYSKWIWLVYPVLSSSASLTLRKT